MVVADLPSTLVVDASIGVKWVVDEHDSDDAAALIAGRRLIVPGLFWVETANVLAMKARRGELTRAAVTDAWRDLADSPLTCVTLSPDTVSSALTLAQDIQHTVYDCIYLAVALNAGCPVVTADRRFATIAAGHPYLAGRVLLLNGRH
ncbi:MAG TPA: type II toxin-antitoxin system VapC family toxin [Rhodospirillaceae bacterium]|nr:type II toxin-antitoxin system VapC family toxin [Rhodospirillaceae bacterium]